jgi:hypothetical protein
MKPPQVQVLAKVTKSPEVSPTENKEESRSPVKVEPEEVEEKKESPKSTRVSSPKIIGQP